MAKKQYVSMQEELAARRAAREGIDPNANRARINGNPPGVDFRPTRGKSPGIKTLADRLGEFTSKNPTEKKRREKERSAKRAEDDSKNEARTQIIGRIAIGGILAVLAVIMVFMYEDEEDYIDYGITENTTHSELMEILEEDLLVDWDIDSDEIREWAAENLNDIVRTEFETSKTEVSREYILVRTVFNGGDVETFGDKCQRLTEAIEDSLYEEFDSSYPSIVIEARMSPTGDNLQVIVDNETLTYLCIDGEEYFAFEDY